MRKVAAMALAVIACGAGLPVFAHATSTNYLRVFEACQRGSAFCDRLAVDFDFSVAAAHWSIGLDDNADARISWGEIGSARRAIARLAVDHLKVGRGGVPCALELRDIYLARHAGEPHLSLQMTADCPARGALEIADTLFADRDASQRTLLQATTARGEFTSLLSAPASWREPAAPSWFDALGQFTAQGAWHVWIGYDHIAFLLLLLLPSVLAVSGGRWAPAGSSRQVLRDVLTVITAFTLAHSVTLFLAATDVVRLPTRFIEAAIAFSIVAAGILNLFPSAARWRLSLAFGFGLVHGFGFANALSELGTRGARLIPALLGFNLGVELGQLAIVLAVVPLLMRLKSGRRYSRQMMPAASLLIAAMGALWLLERTR